MKADFKPFFWGSEYRAFYGEPTERLRLNSRRDCEVLITMIHVISYLSGQYYVVS